MPPGFDRVALQHLLLGLSERIPQLVWTADEDGHWTWSSPRWSAYTGLSDAASQGYGWQTALHPGDRAAMVSAWRNAAARGEVDLDHRLLGTGRTGEAHWFNTSSKPVAGARAEGTIWLGTCTAIGGAKPPRRQPLLRQLERRIVNVVALTRLVSRRTARASESVEDYRLHLDSRLDAIARLQDMMLHDPLAGVDLASIVTEKLLMHATHESERVHVAGPAVRLRGAAADLICLAMHELAMNAMEHGAFMAPLGRIAVTWAVQAGAGGGALRIEWLESETTVADSVPRHVGFGTELIERILPQQLGAAASLDFGRTGLRCSVVVPLTTDVFVPEPRRSDPSPII